MQNINPKELFFFIFKTCFAFLNKYVVPFLSVPLQAVPQISGSGHLQVLSARDAHLLHTGLLEDYAVGASLPPIPSRS